MTPELVLDEETNPKEEASVALMANFPKKRTHTIARTNEIIVLL